MSFFGPQMNGSPSFANAFQVGCWRTLPPSRGEKLRLTMFRACDGVCLLKAAARQIKRDSEPRRDWTSVGKAEGYSGTEEADAIIPRGPHFISALSQVNSIEGKERR